MNVWVFLAGVLAGATVVGSLVGAWIVDRDPQIFDAGRQQGCDDIRPRRPVGEVNGWEPRRERGLSDLAAAVLGVITALLVLAGHALRVWSLVGIAVLVVAAVVAHRTDPS